jgi:trimeric autotransporter adhesin
MTKFQRHFAALACAAALACGAAAATANPAPRTFDTVPYRFSSPEQAAMGTGDVQAFHVVQARGAHWLRLTLHNTQLANGSVLRITSLLDGAQQHLTAQTLAQWRHTSAYFNGSAVRVELIAAPGSTGNRFQITSLMAGKPEVRTESQCDGTDDRVASSKLTRARLETIGCTANLMADGCFITAGHCMASPDSSTVVEFNVPLSDSSGAIRHPPPSEQYVVTDSRESVNGGLANDWGVFTVFANSETGLTPLQAQGRGLDFATVLPVVGQQVKVTGYGIDSGSANQTQQISRGPIAEIDPTTSFISYRSDTEGGNSGSAVLRDGKVVAIHAFGGCSSTGGGANSGTLYTNPAFQAAFGRVCSAAAAGSR